MYIISNELYHHGIKGQKWGIRRYQNPDGTYTEEGKRRYGITSDGKMSAKGQANRYKDIRKTAKSEGYKGKALDKRIRDIYNDDNEYKKGRTNYFQAQRVNQNRALAIAGGIAAAGGIYILGRKLTNDVMAAEIAEKHDSQLRYEQSTIKATNDALKNMEKKYGDYVKGQQKADYLDEKARNSSDSFTKHIYETSAEYERSEAEANKREAKRYGESAMRYKKRSEEAANERETLRDQYEYLKKHPFATKAVGGWKKVDD